MQIKTPHKDLYENFRDALIRFLHWKMWILYEWNKRCFHLRLISVFPERDVICKKEI